MGPLVNHTDMERPGNMKVSQFIENGQCNQQMVRVYAPPLMVPIILSTQIQFQDGMTDLPIWKSKEDGAFTCSSAWEIIRKKPKTRLNSLIWNKNIPFKMSFIWRALRSKLPTNEKLVKFGVNPRACVCCIRPGMDTINHILIEGHFAKYVWIVFAASIGISHTPLPLKNLLQKWWRL